MSFDPLTVTSCVASSNESDTLMCNKTFTPDGNDDMWADRWSSAHADPQTILWDLDAERLIASIEIVWEVASSADYSIEVSLEGDHWTTVVDCYENLSSENYRSDTWELMKTARFIRLTSYARTTPWGNSIWEVIILGCNDPTCGGFSPCGDGVCGESEDCNTCSGDCSCGAGLACDYRGQCVAS
jgi:hypothetical protein